MIKKVLTTLIISATMLFANIQNDTIFTAQGDVPTIDGNFSAEEWPASTYMNSLKDNANIFGKWGTFTGFGTDIGASLHLTQDADYIYIAYLVTADDDITPIQYGTEWWVNDQFKINFGGKNKYFIIFNDSLVGNVPTSAPTLDAPQNPHIGSTVQGYLAQSPAAYYAIGNYGVIPSISSPTVYELKLKKSDYGIFNGGSNEWKVNFTSEDRDPNDSSSAIVGIGGNNTGTLGTDNEWENADYFATYYSGGVAAVESNSNVATSNLLNSYPNPFNPATNLSYAIPAGKTATLAIYNTNGKMVHNFGSLSGTAKVTWNARNSVSSGTYFARLSIGNKVYNKTLVLIK